MNVLDGERRLDEPVDDLLLREGMEAARRREFLLHLDARLEVATVGVAHTDVERAAVLSSLRWRSALPRLGSPRSGGVGGRSGDLEPLLVGDDVRVRHAREERALLDALPTALRVQLAQVDLFHDVLLAVPVVLDQVHLPETALAQLLYLREVRQRIGDVRGSHAWRWKAVGVKQRAAVDERRRSFVARADSREILPRFSHQLPPPPHPTQSHAWRSRCTDR